MPGGIPQDFNKIVGNELHGGSDQNSNSKWKPLNKKTLNYSKKKFYQNKVHGNVNKSGVRLQ